MVVVPLAAETRDPIEVTIGFHVRADHHPLGSLVASAIGTDGVRSPVGGGTEIINPAPANTLINESRTTKSYAFPEDVEIYRITIAEWFKQQEREATISIRGANNEEIGVLDKNNWEWTGSPVSHGGEGGARSIVATSIFKTPGNHHNAGTHILLSCSGASIRVNVLDQSNWAFNSQYIDGERADIDIAVSPSHLEDDLRDVEWEIIEGNANNPAREKITFDRRGTNWTDWRVPNSRWFNDEADCNFHSTWEFKAKGRIAEWNVEGAAELLVFAYHSTTGVISGSSPFTVTSPEARVMKWQRNPGTYTPWVMRVRWEGLTTIAPNGPPTYNGPQASQFRSVILAEEYRHRWQVGATTQDGGNDSNGIGRGQVIPPAIWQVRRTIRDAIERENRALRRQRFPNYAAAQTAAEEISERINEIIEAETAQLLSRLRDDSDPLRCAVEDEAKRMERIPEPWTFECTYDQCPSGAPAPRPFHFIRPSGDA